MGRESSYGSIREASCALRCPLYFSRIPTEVLEGLEGACAGVYFLIQCLPVVITPGGTP